MDQKTAAAIAEENVKTIFAYALNHVSDSADAEDLAGDIIAAFLGSAHKIRDERAVYGFLWSVAANQTRKFYERSRKNADRQADLPETYEELPDPDDFTEEIEKREEIMVLRRELALLSGEYRTCTVAYYFDGLSCREISETYGISVDMVKYYLYKTRRILREGMQMTREFGEKSYKPAEFYFNTIFSGAFNREYKMLFERKLVGNILYSAYYTPMTIGELAVELGVSSVYMEDECRLLEEYDLLKKLPDGRVQTGIFVYTRDFNEEFHRKAEEKLTDAVGSLLRAAREKLPEIRKIGFTGCGADDNRMLWAFLFELMRQGNDRYEDKTGCTIAMRKLYGDAMGVNYGMDGQLSREYNCTCFAGFYGMGGKYSATMADFGVLPEKNQLSASGKDVLFQGMQEGSADSPVIVLTAYERRQIYDVFSGIYDGFGRLYESLADIAAECTKNHAPKFLAEEAEAIVRSSIFFRTVGLISKMAVDSGEITLPDWDGPAAAFVNADKPADCTGVLA